MIFLVEPKQTPDDELLKQKDFRTVLQPHNPPHQNIRFQYVLRAASDLMLTAKPEGGGQPLFLWSDKDLPARKILETSWKLGSSPSLRTGGISRGCDAQAEIQRYFNRTWLFYFASCGRLSRDQSRREVGLSSDIRQAEISTLEMISQLLVIDAHERQDGGVQVVNVKRVVYRS